MEEKLMRAIVAALLGLSLIAATAMPASAQAYEGQRYYKKKKKHQYRYVRPRYEDSGARSDYYEHLADKLPVGSSRWFEQMEREGRFGGRRP
jgi:hypothetical protein